MPVYKITIKNIEQQGSVGKQLEFMLASQTAGFSKKLNRGAKNIRLVGERPISGLLSVDITATVLEKDKYPDSGEGKILVDLMPGDTKKEKKLVVAVDEYLGPKSKKKVRGQAVFTFNLDFTLRETDQEKRRKRAEKFEPALEKALNALLPALDSGGSLDPAAVRQLLLSTANHESGGFECLEQQGSGPAQGVLQMEPKTHKDLWERYLAKSAHGKLAHALRQLADVKAGIPDVAMLKSNNAYSAGMALVRYLDHGAGTKYPVPALGDIEAQARYWGSHYQTKSSAAKIQKYVDDWNCTFGP